MVGNTETSCSGVKGTKILGEGVQQSAGLKAKFRGTLNDEAQGCLGML